MTDFVTSLIRTYVPMAVGALVAWLTTAGINVDKEAADGLVAFLTALFAGAYYLVVRLLERKFPEVGVLLGATKSPKYK